MAYFSDDTVIQDDGLLAARSTTRSAQHGNAGLGSAYSRVFKRVLDLFLVTLAAPLILPLVAVLSVMVMRDGGRPFFRQARVGRGGRAFRIVKLRTMVPDAEDQLQVYLEQNPEAAQEWLEKQKLRNDPRITPVGRLLRASSLDELPQLWNVFVGDMSLVGPRPMMQDQRALYPGRAYFRLRPGITGPWQISERHESAFAKRAQYDETYAYTLSFTGDLRVLLRTVSVVLSGRGC